MSDTFDPAVVARIVAEALQNHSVLPLSFIETGLFDRLSSLLSRYMNDADVTWMMSELKSEFLGGFTKVSTEQLHTIVHNCIKCSSVERPPQLPLWNKADPDLMIVAENPSSVTKYLSGLITELKSAGFSSQRCMLTYVTRCSIVKPDEQIIRNCIPYLHTEIACVNPRLIMTLGLPSYAALTGDSNAKLNDVRSNIFWFGPYPILPEVSLAYDYHAQQKGEKVSSSLSSSLATAKTFLYGGKQTNVNG